MIVFTLYMINEARRCSLLCGSLKKIPSPSKMFPRMLWSRIIIIYPLNGKLPPTISHSEGERDTFHFFCSFSKPGVCNFSLLGGWTGCRKETEKWAEWATLVGAANSAHFSVSCVTSCPVTQYSALLSLGGG